MRQCPVVPRRPLHFVGYRKPRAFDAENAILNLGSPKTPKL